MEDHLKNVKNEIVQVQQVVDAKNKEIKTEEHLKQLSERATGRVLAVRRCLHLVDILDNHLDAQLTASLSSLTFCDPIGYCQVESEVRGATRQLKLHSERDL